MARRIDKQTLRPDGCEAECLFNCILTNGRTAVEVVDKSQTAKVIFRDGLGEYPVTFFSNMGWCYGE